eukprot:snap_masked-scaffold_7-processed-gene-1.33-mRNA-1 protein AED:1.00 eAED:1.00 QI:0/0/0/0/1/1/2/0/100
MNLLYGCCTNSVELSLQYNLKFNIYGRCTIGDYPRVLLKNYATSSNNQKILVLQPHNEQDFFNVDLVSLIPRNHAFSKFRNNLHKTFQSMLGPVQKILLF